jgi:hypothetical protein
MQEKWIDTTDIKNTLQFSDDLTKATLKRKEMYVVKEKRHKKSSRYPKIINYSNKAVLDDYQNSLFSVLFGRAPTKTSGPA